MVCGTLYRLAEAAKVVDHATGTIARKAKKFVRLPPLPSPRELLKLYRISSQKNLSQNFLLDYRLSNKIVTTTGIIRDGFVCEVGPGPGNITRNILQNGARELTVVEKDRRFSPVLQLLSETCSGRMNVIWGDIMDFDCREVFPKEYAQEWSMPSPPFYIIGNLPFNISTPLIIRWLRHMSTHTGPFTHGRTRLTLTFQKEVAERMIAPPKADNRCRLSAMCQYISHAEILFNIPGRAFFPKPEVDVSVVKFTPLIKPFIEQPFALVDKVTRTLFHHRQKYGKFNIQGLVPEDRPELLERILEETGVSPKKRPFHYDMDEIAALCDVYAAICSENKGLFEYDYRNPKLYRKLISPPAETGIEDLVENAALCY